MGGDKVPVGAVVGSGRCEEIGDDRFLVVEFPEPARDDGLAERFLSQRTVSAGLQQRGGGVIPWRERNTSIIVDLGFCCP